MFPIRTLLAVTVLTFCATTPCGLDIPEAAASPVAQVTAVDADVAGPQPLRGADDAVLPRAWSVAAVLESLRHARAGTAFKPDPLRVWHYTAEQVRMIDDQVSADRGTGFFMPRLVAFSYETVARINDRFGIKAALGLPRESAESDQLMVGLGVDLRF